MICGYCRAKNSEEEHRCFRCGRRLHPASPRPAPDTYPVVHGAAAPVLHNPENRPQAVVEQAPPARVPAPPASNSPAGQIQASLFGPQVVPRVLEVPAPRTEKRVQARRPARKNDAGAQAQQRLDFLPEPIDTGARMSADAVIQCSAPVAPRVLRILASVVDATMVVFALALLMATLSTAGVEISFRDRTSLMVVGIAIGSIAILYKLLFVIANGDTVGVRALRMRVVDFDGREPTIRQRVYRFFGGCLSVLAATLGLLWALADEEHLTWHDHVSKTFPTAAPPARAR